MITGTTIATAGRVDDPGLVANVGKTFVFVIVFSLFSWRHSLKSETEAVVLVASFDASGVP